MLSLNEIETWIKQSPAPKILINLKLMEHDKARDLMIKIRDSVASINEKKNLCQS